MSQRKKGADELRQQMTEALLRDVGISERMSAPIVDAVMRCLAGQRAYFPAIQRNYPLEKMRADLIDGASPGEVCSTYNLSRRQLNRIFAGGLPKPTGHRAVELLRSRSISCKKK